MATAVMSVRPRYWKETADGGVMPAGEDEEGLYLFADPLLRHVAHDSQDDAGMCPYIETLFLIIDQNTNPEPNARPVLYRSLLIGSDQLCQRHYHTRAEALAGHAEMCREYLGKEPSGRKT